MKKLQIVALAILFAITGTSFVQANNTLNITNNWKNPLSIHLNENTQIVQPNTSTKMDYNGDIENYDATDTVTGKIVHLLDVTHSSRNRPPQIYKYQLTINANGSLGNKPYSGKAQIVFK